jgi:hypothetical protein
MGMKISPSLSGALKFGPKVDSRLLPAHLFTALNKSKLAKVSISADRVAFSRAFFTLRVGSNLNIFGPFESGVVTIDHLERQISYHLRFRRLLTMGILWVGFWVIIDLARLHSWRVMCGFLLTGVFFVALNLAFGVFRFRAFLHDALLTAQPL